MPLYPPKKVEDGFRVTLSYPRINLDETYCYVDLMDVRSANELRVSFDFDNNVWVVEREDCLDKYGENTAWVEVARIDPYGEDPE